MQYVVEKIFISIDICFFIKEKNIAWSIIFIYKVLIFSTLKYFLNKKEGITGEINQ